MSAESMRKWEREHPKEFKKRRKARAKVNNAIRDGRMKKPAGTEFHHTSYGDTPKGKFEPKAKHRTRKRKK